MNLTAIMKGAKIKIDGGDIYNMKTEYANDKKLDASCCGRFMIPCSIISASHINDKRVAVFSYFSLRRGLDYRVIFTINDIVKWIGKKPSRHAKGINAKIVDVIAYINNKGYISIDVDIDNSHDVDAVLNIETILNECDCERFAVVYVDELRKIMEFEDDGFSSNETVLLVFAYLRMMIPRRRNTFMPGDTDVESRRTSSPEAYDCYLSDIADYLGISKRMVSKSIDILEKLNLIRYMDIPKINKNGKWITRTTIFCNFYKREGGYLLASGKEYYEAEINSKKKKLKYDC